MIPPEVIDLDYLVLRRPSVLDAEAIYKYGSDPAVAYYSDWPIRKNIKELIESLKERETQWNEGQEFSWVITERKKNQAIGGVSCNVVGATGEIGFLLAREFWGREIVPTATSAVMNWLFSIPHLLKIEATCDTENSKSIRVLEKLGFTLEETLYHAIVRPQISSEPRDAHRYACSRISA